MRDMKLNLLKYFWARMKIFISLLSVMTDDKNRLTARERFSAFLQARNKRQTSERFEILERVMEINDHFSIESFYEKLEKNGYHVSMATVYNTFQLLCEAGLLRRHQFDHKQGEYERVSTGNHTHLICTICGSVREVKDAELAHAVEQRRYPNFQPAYFTLYVYGVCKRCRRKKTAKPKQ
jgi:Fur family ferric uptake transcriptional regulator